MKQQPHDSDVHAPDADQFPSEGPQVPGSTDLTDTASPIAESPDLQLHSVTSSSFEPGNSVQQATDLHPAQPEVIPDEKTVISRKPVAPPEAFYSALPTNDLQRLLTGKQLDHFILDEFVGGGGMGAVFRGRDLRLDRIIAIKVVPSARRDAETLRRFRMEAQSAAKLDHPNIARVYYVGEAESWNYIVFEYIDGVNLRDIVLRNGPMSVDDTVFYIMQIADALEHARQREVVHRDIKPSNVLVTPQGQAKLVDMGLARTTELDRSSQDVTASGVTLGTFDYISPEQAKDPRDTDTRSDLYSLGCTWYFLLTGSPPFPEGTALQKLLRHGSERPDDPRFERPELSNDLVAILYKLMAKRPIDRYQTPVDLIADLQVLAEMEDLHRSKMSGTSYFAPELEARSRLEAIIPWFVGLVVLVGSAIWLQSVDRLNAKLELPEPRYGTIDSPSLSKVNSKSSSMESGSNNAALISPLAEPNRAESIPSSRDSKTPEKRESASNDSRPASKPSTSKPFDKPRSIFVQYDYDPSSDSQYYAPSLELALEMATSMPQVDEIVIAMPRLVVGPIKLPKRPMIIRAAEGMQPLLVWQQTTSSDESLGDSSKSFWWDLSKEKLELRGLQLVAHLPSNYSTSRPWSIFRTPSASNLLISNCCVTLDSPSTRPDIDRAILYCDGSSPTNLEPTEGADPRLQLTIQDSIFRGHGCWLKMQHGMKSEIAWSNVFIAMSQRMIDVGGAEQYSKTAVNIRFLLQNVTMAFGQEFASIHLDAQHPYRVCVIKESTQSALWLPKGSSIAQVRGGDFEMLRDCFLLRGKDNSYDKGITGILKATLSSAKVVSYGFDDAPKEIYDERTPESEIVWKSNLPATADYPLQDPLDYLQADSSFVAGCFINDLPVLLRE